MVNTISAAEYPSKIMMSQLFTISSSIDQETPVLMYDNDDRQAE